MQNLKTNKIIVSTYQVNATGYDNDVNHVQAVKMFHREGINYRVVSGVFDGMWELSLLLEATDQKEHELNLQAALNLGRLFNQASVLEVHNDDTAVIHYVATGTSEVIGVFREAYPEEATARANYTYDPASHRYFIVDSQEST